MNNVIDYHMLYESIPFGTELTKVHHVGFLLPTNLNDLNLAKYCKKHCYIDILKANVGIKLYNDIIIELIQPVKESSILYRASSKINSIKFDHFGYLNSHCTDVIRNSLKISTFYTCLFETDVEFRLYGGQKIEIVYDSL